MSNLSIKIVLVGDSGVGKTSLLLQYSKGKFAENQIMTAGLDFITKSVDIDDVQIWDTAGQERFRALSLGFVQKNSQGVVVVYDCEDIKSFESVSSWITEIDKLGLETNKVLVANKCDSMKKVVTKEQGEELARTYDIPFYETSAKENINVHEAFTTLYSDVYYRLKSTPENFDKSKHCLDKINIVNDDDDDDAEDGKRRNKCC